MITKFPKLSHTELKPWFDQKELVAECVLQTRKDLAGYGINLHFSGDPMNAYQELFEQLQPQIESFLSRGSTWMEILYRVDVSELKVREAAEQNEVFSASLTRLILWRELQKVVTRFLISRQPS